MIVQIDRLDTGDIFSQWPEIMPFRPSHRQLEYLVALADTGHFGEAARACHVSQPTLSTQLKLLEDQLGVVLIERGPGPARPTPAGEAILPVARNILTSLDNVVAMASVDAENLGGLVRLGAAPTFGPYFLPSLLPRLHERYPQLEVYVREDRPSQLESALADGALDCIITPLPLTNARFAHTPLCEEEIRIGVPVDHRIADCDRLTTAMLQGERLLTLGRGHRLYENVQMLADKCGAVMLDDYEGTSLDAIRQMVSIGMGLSLFPQFYADSEFVREPNVVLKHIEGWQMTRTICIAWRADSLRETHFNKLAEEAVQVVADMRAKR